MEKFSYFKIGIFVISAVVIGIIGVVVLGVGTIFQKKASSRPTSTSPFKGWTSARR